MLLLCPESPSTGENLRLLQTTVYDDEAYVRATWR